ncbi:MAG: nickel/cobalt ABC transporter permease [Bacillota bacterium]
MLKRFLHHKGAMVTIFIVLVVVLMGVFAEYVAPNDPLAVDLRNKFSDWTSEYPFGTDHLGRCTLSRLIWGIRPTLGLAALTMLGTMGIGLTMGLVSGYFRGWIDEVIMRLVDVMLAFPSQIIVFAVVALMGINVMNVVLANVFIKWAWYARMIRTNVIKYRERNFVNYSKVIGNSESFILIRHLCPSIAAETAVLASLDMGWAIINISTLSFLGMGVQAPTPEWGAMLNDAKAVVAANPEQMIIPGIAIVLVVSLFNMLGDVLRDALDPKEVM